MAAFGGMKRGSRLGFAGSMEEKDEDLHIQNLQQTVGKPQAAEEDERWSNGGIRVFLKNEFEVCRESKNPVSRYAVAFYGYSSNPQLVALVAREEITSSSGQIEPPGMHMIYLPYSDDIRHIEKLHMTTNGSAPRASKEQIENAVAMMRKLELKDFSVYQFSNPALQRHYSILQVLALEEDELPETKDETMPDEEGMQRPGIAKAVQAFKDSVYGEKHDFEEAEAEATKAKGSEASQKRKASAEVAAKEAASYNWSELADTGKLKDLTVVELKYYLTAQNLPVTGKKEILINRILTHLGK